MAYHYKPGKKREIAFVFSCPGQEEENKGQPAMGNTGKNLNLFLEIVSNGNLGLGRVTREDIIITNATQNAEYKKKTNRTEATIQEVLDRNNIDRLYNEISSTTKYIICCGGNAQKAVKEVFNVYEGIQAKQVNLCHLGFQSINRRIKKDIDGKKLIKGEKGNTYKRLEVVAENFKEQM